MKNLRKRFALTLPNFPSNKSSLTKATLVLFDIYAGGLGYNMKCL